MSRFNLAQGVTDVCDIKTSDRNKASHILVNQIFHKKQYSEDVLDTEMLQS